MTGREKVLRLMEYSTLYTEVHKMTTGESCFPIVAIGAYLQAFPEDEPSREAFQAYLEEQH